MKYILETQEVRFNIKDVKLDKDSDKLGVLKNIIENTINAAKQLDMPITVYLQFHHPKDKTNCFRTKAVTVSPESYCMDILELLELKMEHSLSTQLRKNLK